MNELIIDGYLIGDSLQSFMTNSESFYLSLLFATVQVKYKKTIINENSNNKKTKEEEPKIHYVAFGYQFEYLEGHNSMERLGIRNREMFKLSQNLTVVAVDIMDILYKVFTPHACMMNNYQVRRCFGDVHDRHC